MNTEQPLFSIIIIDSRSDKHLGWVQTAIESAKSQNIFVEVIVVNNLGRKKTIGECWNIGVKEAKCDWVLFVGDDDYIAHDLCQVINNFICSRHINNKVVNVATYMTAFDEESGRKNALARQHTGAWKRSYLLEYPFNELLEKGVDREYIEETIKRGCFSLIIEYYYGYFYRKHKDYSCAGEITFTEEPADYFFLTANRIFLSPIIERLSQKVGKENIIVSPHTTPEIIQNAKVIWVEWANEKAIEIANTEIRGKKVLRLHAYEAFSEMIKNIDLNKFDIVIFIDNYIKDYVEKTYGKIKGAVVIPNGVNLSKFNFVNKPKNNKIAYAGYLSRKKGIGELIAIAESLPEYEFHLAGRYQEDDVADYFNTKKPKNVFIYPWQYDINKWYADKSFIFNTSLRESQAMTICEGMACGLKPIVRGWLGSEEIYKKEWIWNSFDDIKNIIESSYNPLEYRGYIGKKFNFEDVYPQIEKLILTEKKETIPK